MSINNMRELYRSPNGDSWFLGREPKNGYAFVIHQRMVLLAAGYRISN